MRNRALTGLARACGSIGGHPVSAEDGAVAWSDLSQAQKNARNQHADRQRTLWGLTQQLERLEAALARTEGRVRGGSLTNDQAALIVAEIEAEAAPLRTETAARGALDELMFSETTFTESRPSVDHWELLWRLRSLRGPLNWSIRRSAPGDVPLTAADALDLLGELGDPLPAGLRALLMADGPPSAKALNNLVGEAIADARARRQQAESRRSA